MLADVRLWILRHVPLPDNVAGRLASGVLPPGNGLVRYRNDDGIVFELDVGEYIQKRIFLHQYYEANCVRAARMFMRPGGVMVDVGANIGQYSLLAAHLVGDEGKVIALEPDPIVGERLKRHVSMNGYEGVIEVLPLAAGSRDEERWFCPAEDQGNSGTGSLVPRQMPTNGERVDKVGDVFKVRVARLDSLLDQRGVSSVDFVKIDVEGFEDEVLHGLHGFLRSRSVRAVMAELWPQRYRRDGSAVEKTMTFMREFGYQAFTADMLGRLRPFERIGDTEVNVFFIAPHGG